MKCTANQMCDFLMMVNPLSAVLKYGVRWPYYLPFERYFHTDWQTARKSPL